MDSSVAVGKKQTSASSVSATSSRNARSSSLVPMSRTALRFRSIQTNSNGQASPAGSCDGSARAIRPLL